MECRERKNFVMQYDTKCNRKVSHKDISVYFAPHAPQINKKKQIVFKPVVNVHWKLNKHFMCLRHSTSLEFMAVLLKHS